MSVDPLPPHGCLERILIVRLGAMGDVIHTMPAVQALSAAFPHAAFGWLIEGRWAELLCAPGAQRRGPRSSQKPIVDQIHAVDLKTWRRSLFSLQTLQQIIKVTNDVRAMRYDAAVDLQGAIRSALLARWSGARLVYGAAQPRESPASLWYTRQAITRGAHVVEQNLSLAEAIAGKKLAIPSVEFPHDAQVESRIAQMLREQRIRDFAILNPGAGWGAKRWPAERFGEIAGRLAAMGIDSLVNFGPGEEDIFRSVQAASAGIARPVQRSITELIALTRRARLVIGGDTGPLHLAAALRVPVVAIFGPTDPARNGPYGTRSIVLRSRASTTTHARHSRTEAGMLEITVDEVAAAAGCLLGGNCEDRR